MVIVPRGCQGPRGRHGQGATTDLATATGWCQTGVGYSPSLYQVKSGVLPYNYRKFKMKIDELQGASAFYRDNNGEIYHTYSTYERGIDLMNTTYNFLDLTAKGRDENPDAPQDWVRYHDEYKGASKDC